MFVRGGRGHGPLCPCCTGGARGSLLGGLIGGAAEAGGMTLGVLLRLAWRFAAGQVVLRPLTEWDARYLTWAPPAPEWMQAMRGPRPPRSRWARRPGWHRQAVRLAALAVAVALVVAPLAALCALLGAALALAAVLVARRHGDDGTASGPIPSPRADVEPFDVAAGPWASWGPGEGENYAWPYPPGFVLGESTTGPDTAPYGAAPTTQDMPRVRSTRADREDPWR